jgi:competence protein ComEA
MESKSFESKNLSATFYSAKPARRTTISSRHYSSVLRSVVAALLASVALTGWCATEAAPKVPAAKPAVQKVVGSPININTADAATLAELNGVGPSKAAAIVEYRKQHGPFKSPEQLADVKGIGDKLIAKNRDRISVR